jgi:hypothetical protein
LKSRIIATGEFAKDNLRLSSLFIWKISGNQSVYVRNSRSVATNALEMKAFKQNSYFYISTLKT